MFVFFTEDVQPCYTMDGSVRVSLGRRAALETDSPRRIMNSTNDTVGYNAGEMVVVVSVKSINLRVHGDTS